MIGKSVSHYKILEKLGQGGMGIVYKAQDTKLDRFVALKFLSPHLSMDEVEKKRFTQEAKSASALDHNNICTIHEINETDDGKMFIAMGYYDGETLKDKIAKGQLNIDEAVDIAIQITTGLEKAHEKEIVHRDIKPANIFITDDNVVKILDFGLAKLSGQTKLTKDGSTLGTVAYMSPEQTQGNEVDHRTDIWSLGVLFYEMISGQLPFKGDYEQAVIYSILNEEPEPLTSLGTGVPRELDRLISKALTKSPDQRCQSMYEVVTDLKALKTEIDSVTEKERFVKGTGHMNKRFYLSAGLVGLLILFVLIGVYLIRSPETTAFDSIAVLPFENISEDPESEPFVKGMHEGMLTELSRIAELTVISRTSVMQYADTRKSIPVIASELGVTTVLLGTVQRVDDRVRVTVQLIDGRNDAHLWAENYDRELTARNIFAIQSELAIKIANQLEVHLTPEEERAVERTPTENLEAYRFYVLARSQLDQRTEEGMRRAGDYFEQAIAMDSSYALAWVGLADAFTLLYEYGYEDGNNVLPRAGAATSRALELNPRLAEAHATLGLLHEARHREGPAAIRELERAVELSPSYSEAHNWLSWVHLLLGHPKEALERGKRAVELNPLSSEAVSNLSLSYLSNGEWRKALVEARHVGRLQPDWTTGPFYEGLAQYHLGRYTEAKSALGNLSVPWAGEGPLVTLALAHVATEDNASARELQARLEEMDELFDVGLIHAAFGEEEEAFEAFGRIDRWDYWPTLSARYFFPHVLGPLREDPRFDHLLSELNRSWGLNPDRSLPEAARRDGGGKNQRLAWSIRLP